MTIFCSTKVQEYVPVDMIDNMTPKEWKKRIIAAYSQKKGLLTN